MESVLLESRVPGESWDKCGGCINLCGSPFGLPQLMRVHRQLCEWPVTASCHHGSHARVMGSLWHSLSQELAVMTVPDSCK